MALKTIFVASAAILSLTACSDTGLSTGPTNKAQTGAVIGGVLGGLVGASSDDDKLLKGVVGAGIGAAAGGVIGNQLDKQAQDLRRDIPNQDIQIENTGSELLVTLPQDVLFDVDSAFLQPAIRQDHQALAQNLRQYPNSTIAITGHTDDTGSDAHNYELSERRADNVSFVLESAGVERARVRALGQGETRPVASNATEAGRAQNRRVEIVIRPNAT